MPEVADVVTERPARRPLDLAVMSAEDGRPAYSMSLPRAAESARQARLLAAAALGVWGLGDIEEEAGLVVTELVSNSVVHARRTSVRVTVQRMDLLVVRLAVADFSRELPQVQTVGGDAERGRGVAIIDALTGGCWGTEPRRWGKSVWAEIRACGGGAG